MILIKRMLLFLFFSALTITLGGAVRSRNFSSDFFSERDLQDNSEFCPAKPSTGDSCSAEEITDSCQYEPYFRCPGDKEPFFLYGCSCFGGVFMCYHSSMLPCDENQVEESDEVHILPYKPEDNNKVGDEVGILPDDNKVGKSDEVTILPYEPKGKGEKSDKVTILPYEPGMNEEKSDKVSILPENPEISDEISTRPLFPEDMDEKKKKKSEECPEKMPEYGQACSVSEGTDICDYAPDIKCSGSDKTHHVHQCYCENGEFYCIAAMIICEDSYKQPKGCPIEKPKSAVDKCKTKSTCKYDPKQIPGEKDEIFQTSCICANDTFMCTTIDVYPQPFEKDENKKGCAKDVKTCSDGTFVVRDVDNDCKFPSCPMDEDFPPPNDCVQCDDKQSKSMIRKSKECSHYKKRQLAIRCPKQGWLKRGYCRNTCTRKGFTKGREECCVDAVAE